MLTLSYHTEDIKMAKKLRDLFKGKKQRIRDMRETSRLNNPEGDPTDVSSHLMGWTGDPNGPKLGNYGVFPTITPKEGYETSRNKDDWKEQTLDEAIAKGEFIKVFRKQKAIDLAGGSWKPENNTNMKRVKRIRDKEKPKYVHGGGLDITGQQGTPHTLQGVGYQPLFGQTQLKGVSQQGIQPVENPTPGFEGGGNNKMTASSMSGWAGAAGTALGGVSNGRSENNMKYLGGNSAFTEGLKGVPVVGGFATFGGAVSDIGKSQVGVDYAGANTGDNKADDFNQWGAAQLSPSTFISGLVEGNAKGDYTTEEALSSFFTFGANQGEINRRAAERRRPELDRQRRKEFLDMSKAKVQNYDTMGTTQQFKFGGRLGQVGYAQGGQLNPISQDAVEVKANNPNMTDSVELSNAFVDNNEMINTKDGKVYSDKIKTPNGKTTIAKAAKKLEKMKSGGKLEAFDTHIENKLNKLFQYQESLNKGKSNKEGLHNGGTLGHTHNGMQERIQEGDDRYNVIYDPTKVQGFNYNGELGNPNVSAPQKVDIPSYNNPSAFSMKMGNFSNNMGNKFSGAYDKSKLGYAQNQDKITQGGNTLANTVGTFGSNVANLRDINRTPEVPKARLQDPVKFQRISVADRLAELSRNRRTTGLQADRTTAQAGAANAIRSQLFASEIGAGNTLVGNANRDNAGIDRMQRMANTNITGRNLQNLGIEDTRNVERLNSMITNRSAERADMSNKFMLGRQEQNQMDLDQQKLALLEKQYEDTGVLTRNMREEIQRLFELQRQRGVRA